MNNYYGNSWEEQRKQEFIASGLASTFMRQVYAIMAVGLFITGLTAWFVGGQLLAGEWQFLLESPTRYIVMFAPLAFVLALSFGIEKMSYSVANMVFGLYALVNGISFAFIFLVFTGTSIATTFFIAGGMFGAMALYGLTTKKDLSSWGSILMMGVFGLIIAGIANIWLQSGMLSFVQSIIGVVIFCALTAYDTQKIMMIGVEAHSQHGSESTATQKVALMGALSLYLDFINLFWYLLRLFGGRRD